MVETGGALEPDGLSDLKSDTQPQFSHLRVKLEVVSVSKVVKIVENMCKEFKVVLGT